MLKEIRRAGGLRSPLEFARPLLVASYFGFRPIEAPRISRADIDLVAECGTHPHYNPAERAALVRLCLEQSFETDLRPLALAYNRPRPRSAYEDCSLHLIGASSSVAEALLIRSALSILAEEGFDNLSVELNCIGDKESLATYERELANFVRRTGADLSPEIREELKRDVFNLWQSEHHAELRDRAPSSISYLSAESRAHFKEVLEYIEALEIEFRINPSLVGNRHYTSHTVFAVKNTLDETLAIGYRYSRLSKHFGFKKEVPMAGATLFLNREKTRPKRVYKTLPKAKFYLVHLGQTAKMRALPLIEILRREHLPVHHLLGRDKLAIQLAHAEEVGATHLIIIGQKEALDNTATVRSVSSRIQDTIPVAGLAEYLRHLPTTA